MSRKYRKLADYLAERDSGEIRLTFGEVEDILGFPLPASASQYQAWWSNNPRSQSLGWLAAGWRTGKLDLAARQVTFFNVGDAVDDALDDADEPDAPPLTIAAAKLALAATYGVDPSQVDITIRG